MNFIILTILIPIFIVLGVPSASSLEDNGDFHINYLETVEYSEYRDWIKKGMDIRPEFFDKAINNLNSEFTLPYNIPINFDECEIPDAFYNDDQKYIVFCYELVEMIHSIMQQNHFTDDTPWTTLGVVNWILLHLAAHALIDTHNFPIIDSEENSADELATYLYLKEHKNPDIIHTAFFWKSLESKNYSDSNFTKTHSLDIERFHNLACWSYARYESEPLWLESGYLPETRSKLCDDEYKKLNFSWNAILESDNYIRESIDEIQSNYESQEKIELDSRYTQFLILGVILAIGIVATIFYLKNLKSRK